MFPSPLTDTLYEGAYDESDDQPWRVMLGSCSDCGRGSPPCI